MERDYYLEAIKSTGYMPMRALRGGGALGEGGWSTPRPSHPTPLQKCSSTHFTGGWVGPHRQSGGD